MSRIAALVAVVGVLVVGGFWLVSRGGPGAGASTAGAVAAAEPGARDASTTDADTMGDASSAQPASEDASAAPAASADATGSNDATSDATSDAATGAEAGAEAGSDEDADEAPDANGPVSLPGLGDGFREVARLSDERRTSFEAPESVLDASRDYAARLETSAGTLILDLYEERTPTTVNNFVFLALNGYYDGIVFHRVLEDFMAQTGDPTGTGRGGPGYSFGDEIVSDLGHDGPGVLSMANSGPDTNGSQFFITFTATPWLDGKHTVFGRVVDGLDVLDALTRVDPQQPQAFARLDDPVERLREQGLDIRGRGTVSSLLEDRLGALPVAGQSFTLGAYRGALGSVDNEPAIGLWPQPDRIETLTIYSRAR